MKTKIVSKVRGRNAVRRAGPEPALRLRVVAAAQALFLQRGFLRVTADDLAGELGISKATLYKAFPSKEEILRAVVRGLMNDFASRVELLIRDGSLGFVEKMVALCGFLGTRLAQFGPDLVRDLRRRAPDIWKEIDDFRREKIFRNFRVILESGRPRRTAKTS